MKTKNIALVTGLIVCTKLFLSAYTAMPSCESDKVDYTQRTVTVMNQSKLPFTVTFKGPGVSANPPAINVAAGNGVATAHVRNGSMDDSKIFVEFVNIDGKPVSGSGEQLMFTSRSHPERVKSYVNVNTIADNFVHYRIDPIFTTSQDNPGVQPCQNDFRIQVDNIEMTRSFAPLGSATQ